MELLRQNKLRKRLYLNILNFVMLPNNGSSLYIQMESTVSPDQYDTKYSSRKGCQFQLACFANFAAHGLFLAPCLWE